MLSRPLFFLFFLLPFCAASHWIQLQHEIRENDLAADCQFDLGARRFDLCPLTQSGHIWRVPGDIGEVGSRPRRVYHVDLGGMSIDQNNNDDNNGDMVAWESGCPPGSWICLSEIGPTDPETQLFRPIAGKIRPASALVDQGVNAIVSISDEAVPASLNLFMVGGLSATDGKPQYARIEFRCDPEHEELAFSGIEENIGVHAFIWRTKYGCGATVKSNPIHILEDETPEGDEPPPSDTEGDSKESEESDGEGELLDPNDGRTSRRSIAAIILITGTVIIAIGIIISSPKRRHFIISHIPAIPRGIPKSFSVGEHTLLRWAEEDMSLELGRGDEDTMVNAESWEDEWVGDSEYIPLKPSPRRGLGRVRDYGTRNGAKTFW
ncbi:hypothetical protein BD779DRAFT_1071265 [Infundibulicybe gibba]|nr:hypothetical protein BD779DRAFT_1071265 [Infundibulicybe gibba]